MQIKSKTLTLLAVTQGFFLASIGGWALFYSSRPDFLDNMTETGNPLAYFVTGIMYLYPVIGFVSAMASWIYFSQQNYKLARITTLGAPVYFAFIVVILVLMTLVEFVFVG